MPLDAPQVRLGGGHVVLAGEKQGHVDRHAREDRLLDGGEALWRAGDFYEEVGPAGPGVEFLAAATVPAVSCAKSGETSSDTQPSRPSVLS